MTAVAYERGPSGELSMLEGPVPGEMRRHNASLVALYEIRERLAKVPRRPLAPRECRPDRCTRCTQVIPTPRIHEDQPYCDWCIRVVTHVPVPDVATENSEPSPHEDSPDESVVLEDPTPEGTVTNGCDNNADVAGEPQRADEAGARGDRPPRAHADGQ